MHKVGKGKEGKSGVIERGCRLECRGEKIDMRQGDTALVQFLNFSSTHATTRNRKTHERTQQHKYIEYATSVDL